ncbi:rhamnan synthesis F family protein [Caballeronia sp. BR00000012568055]|uniref:rhamnan synthesis F family protein n=1 Tax=Caballeronia sp. BR00000012568055 TaxID=2918761 RepID=UPI0023F764B6|nr:rhamnan synthesis F family protein [Caballeronia sp. BR00000012568055]
MSFSEHHLPLLFLVAGPPYSGGPEIRNLLRSLGLGVASQGAQDVNASQSEFDQIVSETQRNMLESVRSAWDDPLATNADWLASPMGPQAVARLASLLADAVCDHATIVLCDDAMPRLLPAWYRAAEVREHSALTLIPIRRPADMLPSLWYRHAKSRAHALLIWLRSLLSAEAASRGHQRAFVDFDRLNADWRGVMQDVAHQLDLVWPVDFDHVEYAIDAALRDSQAYAPQSHEGSRDQPLERLAERAWQAALTLSRDPADAAACAEMDRIASALHDALQGVEPLLAELWQRESKSRTDVDALIASYDAQLADREGKLFGTVKELSRVNDEWAETRTTAAAYEQRVGELTGQVASQYAELEERSTLIETLRRDAELLNSQRNESNRAVQSLTEQLASITATDSAKHQQIMHEHHEALHTLQRERDGLDERLNATQRTLAEMRASTLWRAGQPLRKVGTALSPELRRSLKEALRSTWRVATPWRNPQRRAVAEDLARQQAGASLRQQVPVEVSSAPVQPVGNGPMMHTPGASIDPEARRVAEVIRHSDLFDAPSYMQRSAAAASGMDPALHYVLYGEAQGHAPSSGFDPVYYGDRYPDIVAWGGNRLGHFVERGRAEGRMATPFTDALHLPDQNLDPARPTVLMLLHEGSRTGAPILGWNIAKTLRESVNVVTVILRVGGMVEAFRDVSDEVVGPIKYDVFNPADGSRFGRRLAQHYRPIYVIANSVETRSLVPGLASEGVPVVALVHEFSGYTKPVGSLQHLYERAAHVVFPADIVRRSSEADYPFLRLRETHILPQGPSQVPAATKSKSAVVSTSQPASVRDKLRPVHARNALLVVGMGFVDWRKGVDLFVCAAAALHTNQPELDVRFVWVGHGFKVTDTLDIASYLAEQVERSGISDRFRFVDAVANVEEIYDEADVLFLSSRLDPLPNVSIDAALRGIPVVCFAEASGMAEILASDDRTKQLVVPHLDASAAALEIGRLAANRERLRQFGEAVSAVARDRFDMKRYVAELDRLGRSSGASIAQERRDVEIILAENAFDPEMFFGAFSRGVSRERAVEIYVAQASKIDYRKIPQSGAYTRRPLAGFNPYTFALENAEFRDDRQGEPFASFLRAGRPAGPWEHQVIRLGAGRVRSTGLSVILHGHFHYIDHVGDLLNAVVANQHACKLILTTDTEEKRAEIEKQVQRNGVVAQVRLVENRGRDVGPFLDLLDELAGQCDVIGHVHGKRSLATEDVGADFGDRWRNFLWQHLIGDDVPAMDLILQAFAGDSRLGLVFPEDPHLIGWEENFEIGEQLAARMSFEGAVPRTLDFPVGTMFWARPAALKGLRALGLKAAEYPMEPLPVDGTILHAIERLVPVSAVQAGFRFASTFLPGIVR